MHKGKNMTMITKRKPILRSAFICGLGLAVILPLSSCGFSPAYGPYAGAGGAANLQDEYRQVFIQAIPNREGQIVRNELIDRLHGRHDVPASAARYVLAVDEIQEQRRNFDITEASDTTRTQLRLYSNMRLIDRQENKTLLVRDLEAFSSYNILDSQYTTRVSRESARENGLTDIARQIETQLLLYFKN